MMHQKVKYNTGEKQCKCGNTKLEYVCSDRHRGYYDCGDCQTRVVVDYYA